MLTNNFAGIISLALWNNNATYRIAKDTVGNLIGVDYSWTRYAMSVDNSLTLKSTPEANTTGHWLVLGTETTPATADDVALEALTEDYDVISQTSSKPLKYSSTITTITRIIQNKSDKPLTISEVGLYVACNTSYATMLAREVIDPVTLQPGEKHSFTMDLCVE